MLSCVSTSPPPSDWTLVQRTMLKHLKDMCADEIIHSYLITIWLVVELYICVCVCVCVFVCCWVLFYPDKKLTKFYSTFRMRTLL